MSIFFRSRQFSRPRLRKPRTSMSISRRRLIASLGFTPVLVLLGREAFAKYPDRPIRLIVPFAAGGNADIVGRLVGERISSALGQPVVIDNRGGAGGSSGAETVARAAPELERTTDSQSLCAGQTRLRSTERFRAGRSDQLRPARHYSQQ